MARARNIKPGFYKNEDLAECSVWARLIFPGLWMLADREGRLEDRPKRIKGELLPFDSQETDPLLQELQQHGFLVRYQNPEGRFIQILKFSDHQQPHYSEKPSVIKPPTFPDYSGKVNGSKLNGFSEHSGCSPGIDAASRGGHNPLNPESGFLNPDSPNPEEDGDSGAAQALAPPPPAFLGEKNEADIPKRARVPLAEAWELPEPWGTDAERLGFEPAEILLESERFRQYFVAGKGADTRRSVKGWRQGWSNWLANTEKYRRAP